MGNSLSDKSHQAWRISKKLVSLGYLLEGQGEDHGGVIELEGLGMMLSTIGEELGCLSIELDKIDTAAKRVPRPEK